MLKQLKSGNRQAALAGATPYLRLAGLTAGNTYLAKSALAAGDADRDNRIALMSFMAHNLLGETAALRSTIEQGAQSLLGAGQMLATN